MPLTYDYLLAVTFIVAERETEEGVRPTPIGTGFVVSFPSVEVEGLTFEYVVTASHVVQAETETWARFRQQPHLGGVHDHPVRGWVHHPRADVSLAPLRGHGRHELHLKHIPADMFLGPGTKPIGAFPGERVYFLGLLPFGSLGEQNVPMVRSGTLGAWEVENVPIGPDQNRRRVTAHLIDCRSYAGFSGSPCFIQADVQAPAVYDGITARLQHETYLVELVNGHFDLWGKTRLIGDLPLEAGSIEAQVNSGVGVVTPVHMIEETYEMEELVEDRQRLEEREKGRLGEGQPLDRVAGADEE
jgi:hypothetical protein